MSAKCKGSIFIVACICSCLWSMSGSAQVVVQDNTEANATIYDEFNLFFDREIRRQGVKLNWIFRLKEVYGLHRFDFDRDGWDDVMMEFSAISVEGEATVMEFAVLLRNESNSSFRFFDYMETDDLRFVGFDNDRLAFQRVRNGQLIAVYSFYAISDNKVVPIHE